jgi:hypothetical protein
VPHRISTCPITETPGSSPASTHSHHCAVDIGVVPAHSIHSTQSDQIGVPARPQHGENGPKRTGNVVIVRPKRSDLSGAWTQNGRSAHLVSAKPADTSLMSSRRLSRSGNIVIVRLRQADRSGAWIESGRSAHLGWSKAADTALRAITKAKTGRQYRVADIVKCGGQQAMPSCRAQGRLRGHGGLPGTSLRRIPGRKRVTKGPWARWRMS